MKSNDLKERLIAAVPIEAYIGRHVHLKKAGKYLKGLCPFHQEKTPSFTVTPDKGLYHCFGCGKGGDLFRFVMDLEGVEFSDALDILCSFAGIDRSNYSSKRKGPEEELARLNAAVLKRFREFLASSEGGPFQKYLIERGIKAEIIEKFQLGAAPNRWDFISAAFPDNHKELLALGVLRQKEGGDRPYDFYRGRVIFPIQDLAGRVLGFGGRILPEFTGPDKQVAKYVNSSDSKLYHKSEVLYGLPLATSVIRQEGCCYLVEGYLDVIGLHQVGVANVVAPLGTAFTAEQMRLLARYSNRVVALFDGDVAGRAAAVKFSRLSLDFPELDCSIVLLPAATDPFDISMQWPAARLQTLLGTSIKAERFFILETMFPEQVFHQLLASNKDQDESAANDASEDPIARMLDGLKNLQLYYAGDRPDLMPAGSDKRPGLNRLYAALSEIKQHTDRQFILEDAARILRLDWQEVMREMQAHLPAAPHGQDVPHAYSPVESTRSRMAPRPGPTAVQRSGQNQERVQDKYARGLQRCERQLMVEFIFHPGLISTYLPQMEQLVFVDMHSEILWRYLEARLLTGDLWNGAEFPVFNIPGDCMAVFNEDVLKYELDSGAKSQSGSIIKDIIQKHQILTLEKSIAEFGARYVVADSVDQARIMIEWQAAQNELRQLKAIRRGLD